MKKTLAVLIFTIILIALISPFFIGIAAEKQIGKQISFIEKENNISVSNAYKRNWFTSSAETTFSLAEIFNAYNIFPKRMPAGFKDIIIKTRSEIIHGPFPLKRFYSKQPVFKPVLSVTKNVTKIILPPDISKLNPTVTTYISTFPDGNSVGAFTIPGANLLDEDVEMKISQIDGEMSFSPDMSSRSISFNLPEFLLNEKSSKTKIDNLKFSFQEKKKEISKLTISFDNFLFGKSKIKNCALAASTKESNGLLAFDMKIDAEEGEDENGKAGPIEFSLTGKKINKDACNQIISLYKEMNNKRGQNQDDKIANVFLITQVLSLLPEILSESPEIILSNKIGTPDGNVLLDAQLKISDKNINEIKDIRQIINSIIFNLSMTFPESAAQKYIFMSDDPQKALAQKMMIKDGENYKLDLIYKNAELTVNGQPFSLFEKENNTKQF